MNYLQKIKDQLPDYWELKDDSNEITTLKKYILESKEEALIIELQNTISQSSESGIDTIYEVFYDLEIGDKFGNLILKEFERAFETAKESKDPDDVLYAVTQLGPYDFESDYFEKEIIKYLTGYLKDENPIFRHNALFCLDDWIDEENANKYVETISSIEGHLSDKNWKIRYLAYDFLKEIGRLSKSHKISFLDKLRFKYGNPYGI